MAKTINRRQALDLAASAAALAGAAAAAGPARAATSIRKQPPIVLYCDLVVDPAREQEMLEHFHRKFKPAGAKFKGFIDLKMLKLRNLLNIRSFVRTT